MKKRILGFFLGLMLLTSTTVSADVTIDSETNAFREAAGLTTLATSGTLESIAAQRAVQTASNFNHAQWIFSAMGCITWAGENIAWNYSGTGFAQQWYNSAPHKSNMLNPSFDSQGSAVYYDANTGKYFAVQVFADTCATNNNAGSGNIQSPNPTRTPANSSPPAPTGSSGTQEPVTVLPDTSTLGRGEDQ